MTNMELSESVSLLQSSFDFYYVKEIRKKMLEIRKKMLSVFKARCSGCQNSRLSQMDHACLTLTDEQQLKLYFENILQDVDESDILKQWNDAVSPTDIPLQLIEMFRLQLYCLHWRGN